MPNKSLSRSGLLTYQKYSSLLAGNDPYIPALPAYDLLETEILTGSQASVTFSSLDAYATDYQHLQIRLTAATNRGGTRELLYIQANGETSFTNYYGHSLGGDGSSVYSNSQDLSKSRIAQVSGTGTTGAFGVAVIDILDPFSTNKQKTFRSLSGQTDSTGQSISLHSALWRSSAAITSLSIVADLTSMIAGSRLSLYGFKKASA